MAAWLMRGASTCWAQPCSNATRPRLSPTGGKTLPRAGRHAGEAGQAAVDMLYHLGGRRAVLLQHLLDEIDPAARAIEFVAQQHIGRTGRGAEAAMHAGAQDLVGFGDVGIGELGEAE